MEVEAPSICRQLTNKGGKVVDLRTGRLYLPEDIPDTHFCWRL